MTSIDSVKPALAHPFPINITGDVLAANFKICQPLNRWSVLGRDKPPSNPLLDVLVSPDAEKPCSTNGASKDFNCSRYRIRFVHETNSIQDKLVLQAEKQECLAVTGKKNRPTVPSMNTVESASWALRSSFFFLYLIGKYDIPGLPALLLTFGFAFVWESFVVRQGDRGGD